MSQAVQVQASPEGVPGAVTDPSRVIAEELTFTGADGTQVNGYLARPAESGPARRPAMIVIHEAGGLNEHIRDMTNRFANLGYVALGVDLYTREGGPPAMDDLPARARLLRGIQPGAPFVVIADAGHWVQYEAAAAFNAALGELLRSRP